MKRGVMKDGVTKRGMRKVGMEKSVIMEISVTMKALNPKAMKL